MRSAFILALGFVVAGCGEDPFPQDDTPYDLPEIEVAVEDDPDVLVIVDANGLSIGRRAGKVSPRFTTPVGPTDSLLATAFGIARPQKSDNEECGAGPMEFSTVGPLKVAYRDNRFAGWFLTEGPSVVTSDGIRPGMTMAELQSRFEVRQVGSTLPGEFEYTTADYGTIGGFSEDGVITSLHAGLNCFFR